MKHDHELAAKLYARPATTVLIGPIVDMGEALNAACVDLARNPTPEHCDQLLIKMQGAQQGVRQFRRALIADGEMAGAAG